MMLSLRKKFISPKLVLLSLIPLLPILVLLMLLVTGQTASSESLTSKIETPDGVSETQDSVLTKEEQAPIHSEVSEQVSPNEEDSDEEDDEEEEEDC